ncbi:hypothetical protein Pmar_PMAR000029 [Perkinsus marinus ATCC 50983]|uniref:Uncharacterized protein n=1 Tax=Perkinsus marinus (strain ATCC 50983 / TXsc) TaxID=423536 RepID=C5KPP6_PERM5|nr:hypothetical protein Pmar_PMAR000029 [Perkinsus marinus ATCC 50983]EER13443.1 hypothetical protein Pmar_PMAR000029 [Perkinsus marinus ATCC 50983]|eukprot:XP_002781648.1 hypothetical protein Pmar_PMAR000029 [Perkinsus marinus ATCC 50983]
MGKYYDDTSEDVSGKLTFYPDYTLSMHVNLYGCAVSVSGVKYSKLTAVGKMTYEFTISYAGTDLANQINACKKRIIRSIFVSHFKRHACDFELIAHML